MPADTETTSSRLGSIWARLKGAQASESLEMRDEAAAEEGRAMPGKPGTMIFQTNLTNRAEVTTAGQAGETPESGVNQFRYFDKCNQDTCSFSHHSVLMNLGDDIPEGWPRFAHDQNRGHNRSIHRRFGDFNQRLLLDYEITLKLIRDDIMQLDKADEKTDSRILRGLSPHHGRDNGAELGRFEKRRELIREGKKIIPKYCTLLSSPRIKPIHV